MVHEISLTGYSAIYTGKKGRLVLGTAGSYGIEKLHLVYGVGWEGRTASVIFTIGGATVVVLADSDGSVQVPPEATAVSGTGAITILGVDETSQRISVDVPYLVMAHADVKGDAPDPTPSEWQQFVAAVKADADRAEQAAGDAADSAAAAAKSAEAADESAKKAEQAGADIGEAKDTALEAIQQAQDTGVQAVQTAHKAALDDIATDRQQALADIEGAGDKQTAAITSGGAAALEAIGQVEQAAIGQVQQAGTAQVAAVETAGQAQLDKINAANALVPTPSEADAGKAVLVKPDGSGYELGDVKVDAYSKAESDERYAPIAAAIRPTVSGNPATLGHSVAWALQGLAVYGKSMQDGIPSSDNPVPIMSAGGAGSITVTVSDGADHSQQLIISTPNGLPGIPVPSGGNYTDADGQQWICDEYDFERGLGFNNIYKIELDGKENIEQIEGSAGPYYQFDCDDSWPEPLRNTGKPFDSALMSNYFQAGNPNSTSGEVACAVTIDATNRSIIRFRLTNDALTTVDDVKEWLKTKHDDGAPVTMFYGVSNPDETPLTAEELAAYAALRTYDGTTIVATDAPVAGLSARYVADGAAYIDSKIQSAITQAVTAATALTGGAP